MLDIYGIFTVLCTPFTDDDKIDEKALRKHVRYLIDEGGVHGVLPNGSTGEFAALSDEELRQVTDVVIDEVNGKVPVVVGAAAVATRDMIARSQYAQKAGADGIMVVPSYYCHPSDEEIYAHYKALTENVDVPIVIYNNPGTSGVDMQPELVARLAQFDQITHIKESSGDMTRVSEIMRLCGDKITVFCGCDNLALEMFLVGARGWIVPAGNMIPQLCVKLFELAVEQKDVDKAKILYYEMLPLFTMFETTGQYVQLTKAGLDLLGRPYGDPRKPLLTPAVERVQALKEILESLDVL